VRLILAVSADNLFATGPDDDMSWTGKDDKAAFRLLTSVGGTCFAGRPTWASLPPLPGREVHCLSRSKGSLVVKNLPPVTNAVSDAPMEDLQVPYERAWTLGEAFYSHPNAWLLGGPTVGLEALSLNMVDQVYLCRSPLRIGYDVPDAELAYVDRITPWLMSRGEMQNAGVPWKLAQRIRFGDVNVHAWRRLCPIATERPLSGAG
jgi:dihydrofolate reductase